MSEEITYDDVMVLLAAVTSHLDWSLDEDVRTTFDGECPLCAMCRAITGRSYHNVNFLRAADEIGIPPNLARRVAEAADNSRGRSPDVRKLHAALGLA